MIVSAVILSFLSVVSASSFAANKLLTRATQVGLFVASFKAGDRFRKHYEEHYFESPANVQFWRGILSNSGEEDYFVRFNLAPRLALYDLRVRRQQRFLHVLDSYSGNSEELKRLLWEGADPNSQDFGMKDFFDYAFKYNFPVDLIAYALEKGASKNHRDRETGLTPLDRAIALKRFDISRVIIEHDGRYSKSLPTLIKDIVANCDDNDFDIQAQHLITEIYWKNGRMPNIIHEAEKYLRTANKPNIQQFISHLRYNLIKK